MPHTDYGLWLPADHAEDLIDFLCQIELADPEQSRRLQWFQDYFFNRMNEN